MMNSRTLFTFISLYISLCVLVVAYFLYSSQESQKTYPMVAIAFQPVIPISRPQKIHVPHIPHQQREKSSDNKRDTGTHRKTINQSITFDAATFHPPVPKSLPYPKYLKKADEIQQAPWTTELYEYLKSLNHTISPQVNMVFGDSRHLDLVMNWIIAAHVRLNPPLHNILVISIDQELCDLLQSKKVPFTCIIILPESFLASTGPESYQQGIKTRLLVLRLINFWGYDVASYDSDAVLLRNPQPLYDSYPDVQMFAGSVRHPPDVVAEWGFTICGGTLIVKSHPSTENLWKAIHRSTVDECEQSTWNHAMLDIGVKWNVTTNVSQLCLMQTGWQSYDPLPSVVFPQNVFCRKCCDSESTKDYYLVHLNAKHSLLSLKRHRLQHMNSWFLRGSWGISLNSSLEGDSWLNSISNV